MYFKKAGSRYILRLVQGEDVLETLNAFCRENNILLGRITALGGMENVTLGLLRKSDKQFVKRTFDEGLEVASLFGTITEQDGAPYLHVHVTVCDANMQAYGGHFFGGTVFPTLEVIVEAFEGGHVGRAFDPDTGLVLMDLS